MEKHQRLKYYRLKALKEASIIATINLILIFLVIKFDNSTISFLLKNLGFGIVIVGVIIFVIWYVITYIINYVYGELDIKVKK